MTNKKPLEERLKNKLKELEDCDKAEETARLKEEIRDLKRGLGCFIETDVHVLGTAIDTKPEETIEVFESLPVDKDTLYFSQVSPLTWFNPSRASIVKEYLEGVATYLFKKGAKIVPMVHPDFMSFDISSLRMTEMFAAQTAEAEYMVGRVVLPRLKDCRLAVVDVTCSHSKKFDYELTKYGILPAIHGISRTDIPLVALESIMAYADGRKDNVVDVKRFNKKFREKIGGRITVNAEDINADNRRLSSLLAFDPEARSEYEQLIDEGVFDDILGPDFETVPSPEHGNLIRSAYSEAKEFLRTLNDQKVHTTIEGIPKGLFGRLRGNYDKRTT
jgi:hypothetical protein